MLGIDTKILVRLLVADDADQTRRARRIGVRGPVKRDLLRLHGRGRWFDPGTAHQFKVTIDLNRPGPRRSRSVAPSIRRATRLGRQFLERLPLLANVRHDLRPAHLV